MKKAVFIFFLLGKDVSSQNLTILNSFASPSSTPFGLEWINGFLWNSDRSTQSIYKLDPSNGAILTTLTPGIADPAGLAWTGTYLFCADWSNGKIYKMDTLGTIYDSFSSPGGSPFGLAWDGTNLLCAEVFQKMVYKIDPVNYSVISSVTITSANSNITGVTWDGTELWVAVDNTSIARCDPSSGQVIASYNAPGSAAKGLTWNGQHLWSCDNGNDTIYQLITPLTGTHDYYFPANLFSLHAQQTEEFSGIKISFSFSEQEYVTLSIYNMLGKRIQTLFRGCLSAGSHHVVSRELFAPGVYFCILDTKNKRETTRFSFVR